MKLYLDLSTLDKLKEPRWLFMVGILILIFNAGCSNLPSPQALTNQISPNLSLKAISFEALPGWETDHTSTALAALLQSCHDRSQRSSFENTICYQASLQPAGNDKAAQKFFEAFYQPYAIINHENSEGLFTGYYEAELHGSWHRHGLYQTPLYERPDDLITVDPKLFRSAWPEEKHPLVGRVSHHQLIPYDTRVDITRGSLKKRAKVLLWVNNPIDAYFLAIQGSGRVHMTDGSILHIGYDGSNGHAYTAIGHILRESGELTKPVTMQSIRVWLQAHPKKADTLMNLNKSYVFFKKLKTIQPLGAEGIPLTPKRSLAVDTQYIPLGTPLWLDTTTGYGAPLQLLVIAQDVGGAIKGPLRGDYFWGYGSEAEDEAGRMQSIGTYYILLPNQSPSPPFYGADKLSSP